LRNTDNKWGEKIHETEKSEKVFRITSGCRECRWIDKPFVVSTLIKSIQFGRPAGRNTMVESNEVDIISGISKNVHPSDCI
jgi:hypothetical protein